jgi:drug/metabolite transporter (DMT)-like permease
MLAAITVLSQGTQAAASTLVSPRDTGTAFLAVTACCLSGIAYGAGGVMIRRCVRRDASNSGTIAVLSTTGIVTLGAVSLFRIGPRELLATTADVWWQMLGAGIATAVAFFAITGAYRHLSAVRVTLLNASQAAIAALSGVVLFGEPNTVWLQAGTILTILGLILAARPDAPIASRVAGPSTLGLPADHPLSEAVRP